VPCGGQSRERSGNLRAELTRLQPELDEHRREYPNDGGLVTINYSRFIYSYDSPFQPPKVFRFAELSYGKTRAQARRQKPASLTAQRQPQEEWTHLELWVPPLRSPAKRPRVIKVAPPR
jgi:hypothetical protein